MKGINYNNYGSIYDKIEVDDALQTRIEAIEKTLKIVTELDKWEYAYSKDKWTIKELVQHCIDCERIFSYRAQHIARGDAQELNFFDENAYSLNANANNRNPKNLIEEWSSLMKSTYYQFLSYDEQTLSKKGKVGDKQFSVQDIGYIIAGHTIHHMEIINKFYL